jgi:hypothetical protein
VVSQVQPVVSQVQPVVLQALYLLVLREAEAAESPKHPPRLPQANPLTSLSQ